MRTELISVIMPAYNAADYLAESIDSVLSQEGVDVELIVVDDGSIDATPSIAQSYGEKLIFRSIAHVGLDATRNVAIKMATGKYLAFCDSDDLYVPGSLAMRLHALTVDPAIDAVYGAARQFYSPEIAEELGREVRIPQEIVAVEQANSLLLERSKFLEIGLFGNWGVGGGVDWTLRSQEVGLRSVMLDDVVFDRRIHRNNNGRTQKLAQTPRLHILKAALDRRRQQGPAT